MQGPKGVSGVHFFRKCGHCSGCFLPRITFPQRHPLARSFSILMGSSNRFLALCSSYSGAISKPDSGMVPIPLHLASTILNAFSISFSAFMFPSGRTILV